MLISYSKTSRTDNQILFAYKQYGCYENNVTPTFFFSSVNVQWVNGIAKTCPALEGVHWKEAPLLPHLILDHTGSMEFALIFL